MLRRISKKSILISSFLSASTTLIIDSVDGAVVRDEACSLLTKISQSSAHLKCRFDSLSIEIVLERFLLITERFMFASFVGFVQFDIVLQFFIMLVLWVEREVVIVWKVVIRVEEEVEEVIADVAVSKRNNF